MMVLYTFTVETGFVNLYCAVQGPQDEIEYWKGKAAHLTLLVDQMMAMPTKMTLVTLR